jgi:hypothetical protein
MDRTTFHIKEYTEYKEINRQNLPSTILAHSA